jgi:beta propeller repeat protein
MKNMKKILAIFVCLLFFGTILAASALVCAPKPDKPPGKPDSGEDEPGTEYQITFSEDGGGDYNAMVYGNIIVWFSYRYGLPDIFMFDLGEDGIPYTDDDGGETRITTDPTTMQLRPAIWENRVVYDSVENGNWDIFLYDIATGITTQITTDPGDQLNAKIYGDCIAWMDYRNGNRDIYAYDLGTGTEMQITTDPSDQAHPFVYGDIIAWTDFRNGVVSLEGDIYMYKFSTGEEYAITDDDFRQNWQHIWDNKIVWSDGRNGVNTDIYMYDLGPDGIPFTDDTGEGEYQLTSGDRKDTYPKLYGDLVAFHGFSQFNRNKIYNNIYIYNLVSGDTTQITTSNEAGQNPRIFENHIVYDDMRSGTNDVYLFILD